MYKRGIVGMILALVTLALLAAPAFAAVTATDVKAKVDKAAAYLADKGPAGLAEFSDTQSEWAQPPYIFVYDLKGTIIAHGSNPKLVGKNLMGLKDVKGNMFAAEFVAIAKDKGHGWSEYWWPKKGEKEASLKASYIKRVPGQDMLVGAGIYGYSKDQATAEAGN